MHLSHPFTPVQCSSSPLNNKRYSQVSDQQHAPLYTLSRTIKVNSCSLRFDIHGYNSVLSRCCLQGIIARQGEEVQESRERAAAPKDSLEIFFTSVKESSKAGIEDMLCDDAVLAVHTCLSAELSGSLA
ncbi:hypothetical protein ILYODFUR_016059 [Ilyodon furcidens]|uniref:Uncharacterized protein n=1 Tax=Ilyodon furcidens TaxID=33524 RepID=A0ABV0TMR0_9TELE